jgi:hypothetical protein
VLLRCSIIAAKYATFSGPLAESMKTKVWNSKEFTDQLTTPFEKQQKDHLIERELLYCMQRHQIDDEIFRIWFMVPVKEELKALLKQ